MSAGHQKSEMQLTKLGRTHVQAVDTQCMWLTQSRPHGISARHCLFHVNLVMLLCLLDVRAPPHYNYQPPASLRKPGITFQDGSSYRLMNGIVDCHLFGAASSILTAHVRPTESSTSPTSLDRESSSDLDAKGSWPRTFPYPRPPTFSIDFPLCRTTPPLSTPATAGGVTGRTGASS